MKKFASIFALFLLLISCRQTDENYVEFKSADVDRTVALSSDANSPVCTVHLNMTYATEANGHKAEVINGAINSKLLEQEHDGSVENAANVFADEYIKKYKTLLPLYNQDRADSTKRAWYEYHYVITTSTQMGNKNTIVYLATVDYYEGGAHSTNQLLPMNFEAKTGRLLKLEDIFVDGFELELTKILLEALKEKTGTSTIMQLQEQGYLRPMALYPTENFILGDETITFVYNPSEIAAYDIGAIELIIPYTDMEKIIRNSFEY